VSANVGDIGIVSGRQHIADIDKTTSTSTIPTNKHNQEQQRSAATNPQTKPPNTNDGPILAIREEILNEWAGTAIIIIIYINITTSSNSSSTDSLNNIVIHPPENVCNNFNWGANNSQRRRPSPSSSRSWSTI